MSKKNKGKKEERAIFEAKEKAESYKYLFETTKHITTLNTGLLVYLASLKTGFFTGQILESKNIGIAFLGIMVSTFFSLATMFTISYDTQNDSFPFFQTWKGKLLIIAEIAAFLLAIGYLLGAAT